MIVEVVGALAFGALALYGWHCFFERHLRHRIERGVYRVAHAFLNRWTR